MTDVVAVDPSLAVAWIVTETHTPPARSLLIDWQHRGVRRIAPALFASESASAFRSYVRRGLFDVSAGAKGLAGLLTTVEIQPDDVVLAPRAFEIACALGAGRAYDSLYAALAEREDCELWTGDQRFYNAAHVLFPWVHFVAEASFTAPPTP